MPPGLPDTIGPYRLLRPLGAGASGTVYLAERTDFAQRVAVKLFHPDLTLPVPAQEEQRILALLDHPHVVRVLQQPEHSTGSRFLVMEYVEGEPIDTFADGQRLPLEKRVELLLQALDALEYAHSRLIVHRDLKPANLLVTRECQAKLLDFGAASAPESHTEPPDRLTPLTPIWSSPEQRDGSLPVAVASDVYSLGMIARLLLCGAGPSTSPEVFPSQMFSRLDPEAQATIAAARATTPTALARALRGDLDAILLRALAHEPGHRYGSAALFAADLRAWSRGAPVVARPVHAAERGWRWVLRHRLLASATGLLLAVLLLSVAGVLWQSGKAIAQRRRAESRLRDLVEMTGTLDGDLYTSLGGQPGAGEARTLLLRDATDTLDGLAGSDHDPALSLQLAAQYAHVARLQLARPRTDGADGNAEAQRDITRGLELLEEFRRTGKNRQQAEATRAELESLAKSLPGGN